MWPSTYLIPGARALSGVDLVAVCGRDSARTSAFAQAHGDPHAYDDIERMLREEHLDGVIIATPPCHHEVAVRTVCDFDVAVLCEKPLALEGESARRIRDLLSDMPVLTGFTLRWHPLFRELHDVIADQVAGPVRHVRIRYLQSFAATPARAWDWHFDADAEPLGVVSDLGPHAIDLVRWVVGDVTQVTAFARTTIPHRVDAEGRVHEVTNIDDADLHLETETGTTVSLTISRVAPDADAPGGITVEVLTEEGRIRADSNESDVLIGTASGLRRRLVPVTAFVDGAGAQISDFVDLTRGLSREGLPSIEDGYRAQLVMDAVTQSLERRETTTVQR